MGSGFARGMAAQGKRMAFGDGQTIDWHQFAHQVYANNPNVAPPGSEQASDLVWHPYRRGNRLYNRQHPTEPKWIWNMEFRAPVGEVFLTEAEQREGDKHGRDFIVLEPNAPGYKPSAVNKQWEFGRWQKLATVLAERGHDIVQFEYDRPFRLARARMVRTASFRQALAVLRHAKLVVTPEGGLHHAAAALGVRAVVLFGGFIPPEVTGYPFHDNIAIGQACGNQKFCQHCIEVMALISVERVLQGVEAQLAGRQSSQ
jgi:ADP-heptose:LPS heptosyltransferase